MKIAFAIFAALISVTTAELAGAATCKVVTPKEDIGTIYGKGKSDSDAYIDAATQCFERREAKKGGRFDEDTGIAVIDLCANIKCSS